VTHPKTPRRGIVNPYAQTGTAQPISIIAKFMEVAANKLFMMVFSAPPVGLHEIYLCFPTAQETRNIRSNLSASSGMIESRG
jgi:hypothetical protein